MTSALVICLVGDMVTSCVVDVDALVTCLVGDSDMVTLGIQQSLPRAPLPPHSGMGLNLLRLNQ